MDKRPNIFILYEMPHSCKHFMCQQGKKKLKIVLNVTNIYKCKQNTHSIFWILVRKDFPSFPVLKSAELWYTER